MLFPRYRRMLMLCVLSLALYASGAIAGEEVQTVTIGFVGALSGVSESFGKGLANAAELAIFEANRNPFKINGKRVQFRLVRMDDRNDAERARRVATALVQAEVVGVIGGTNSNTSIAVSKIFADAGIPQISPTSSFRRYTDQGFRTTFRMLGIDDDACIYLGEYVVKELHAQRIAVIDNGTTFGVNVSSRFSEVAREHGGVIVSRDSVSDVLMNFGEILRRVKAQDIDAVFFGGYSEQTSMLAKSMLREEVKARLVTSMNGIVGSSFLISSGIAANGTVAQETGMPFNKMPGWKKFEADFSQRFDFQISIMTPYAYDAAHVLMAAVRQANSLNPHKITNALHEISFKGLTGVIAFDAVGNPRSPSYTIYEVQNRKWKPMKTNTMR